MDHPKQLRKAPTDAEAKLWQYLRNNQLGVKFRRQHRMQGYILDFACLEKNLVIELDGGQHADQIAYDQKRTALLESLGFRVVRFWDHDALQQTNDVLEAITRELSLSPPPHPNPLPRCRRGRGSRATIESLKKVEKESPLPQACLGERARVRGKTLEYRNTHQTSVRTTLEVRAKLYALIRRFFAERNVLEVETPILSQAGNTDPNIESFQTDFNGHTDAGARKRWLRTSPEYPLKRLLASGVGDCYELGRVFRNEQSGQRHNPEFTMLEWYRVGWDHLRLMNETVELVLETLTLAQNIISVEYRSYRQLFIDFTGIDPFIASTHQLQESLSTYRIDFKNLARDDLLNLILTHRIEPQFKNTQLWVIYDFPATQCALAKIRPDEPPVAERFELYLGSFELANGYHELTDATEQRARFVLENKRRCARGQPELPIDENLLAALAKDMPTCAGVALGIERLLMYLLATYRINDVLAFSFADA